MKISNFPYRVNKFQIRQKSGQTLVFLLVFMAIAIVITSATVIMTVNNSTSTSSLGRANAALTAATSGAENGLMRLLRDPNYSGETLTVGDGSATISVANGVITSMGKNADFSRTVLVTTSYTNNVLTVISWKEKF